MVDIFEDEQTAGFQFAEELLEGDSLIMKLRKAIFRAHARDYNIQKDSGNTNKASLLGHLLLRLITTLQLLTLVIPLESSIYSYSKFEKLIKLLYCLRYDYLFHAIKQDWTFWYLHIGIVSAASILFFADYILLLSGIKRSQSRLRAIRLYLMCLIKEMMLVPIVVVTTFHIAQDFGYVFE
jgi:hypothetical protein